MVIDLSLKIEWARIPTLLQFLTSINMLQASVPLALFKNAHGRHQRKRALEFLSSGGSKFPIDLLKGPA